MEQLIEFLDIRQADNSNLQPVQNPINSKIIINNPTNVDSGYLTLDTTSLIQIQDVNYVFLISKSNQNFNITIINDNGQLEMQACQFNYQNAYIPISLVLTNPNSSSIQLNKLTCNYTLT